MSISICGGETASLGSSARCATGEKRARDMSSSNVSTRGRGSWCDARRAKSAADSALNKLSSQGRSPIASQMAIWGVLLKNTESVLSKRQVHMPNLRVLLVVSCT